MFPLRDNATLADLQRYVAEMEQERGFTGCTIEEQSLKLAEEIGELFKAIRKRPSRPASPTSVVGSVDEEVVDVLIYLCSIANRMDIDLENAFRRKEELNETRTWA